MNMEDEFISVKNSQYMIKMFMETTFSFSNASLESINEFVLTIKNN